MYNEPIGKYFTDKADIDIDRGIVLWTVKYKVALAVIFWHHYAGL